MFDVHYDLLTILYFNFMKNNKYADSKKCIKDINKIYREDNIMGGIIDLYFMNQNEMFEDLDIHKDEFINVVDMFKKSINILNDLKKKNIIPKFTKFLYSIEGCDYINSTYELETLYNLGLRSILLTWNNENKYGSGYKSNKGLTNEGKAFIKKAIDLGIIIDLSHANENTFNDIYGIIKKEKDRKKDVLVIASHSNCRNICDRKRNLSDEQLIKLKEIDGYIGLFSHSDFLSTNFEINSKKERKEKYVEHINHVLELGFNPNRILLSTDDMNFEPNVIYHGSETFNLENAKDEVQQLLIENFDEKFANKLMYENFLEIFNRVENSESTNQILEEVKV